MSKRLHILLFAALAPAFIMQGQEKEDLAKNLETKAEVQVSASDNQTPLWLNANKYGLSSLEEYNGYARVSALRPAEKDEDRKWRWGYGLDMAVAANYTSTVVVQQAYAELGWKSGLLTIGSKEIPMELKNQRLSSGSQTFGINARPVPQVRLALPDYWTIPALGRWFHIKGHIAYGAYTDERWQESFTAGRSYYNRKTLLNTKAAYLKIANPDRDCMFSLELGLEMACQFGGELHTADGSVTKSPRNFASFWHAFKPGGQDASDGEYGNIEGNHLGSWVARATYDADMWKISAYFDHFFEDQSMMFLFDYDGYGTGENWNKREKLVLYQFPLKDMMLGTEVEMPYFNWLKCVVFEYIYTKYQSGPFNHDRTENISDHLAGCDDYYNHGYYTGWQHWGQVMGNPLYRSPIYNTNGKIYVEDNRFVAFHLGLEGSPLENLDYRLLATYQKGWGTYDNPYTHKLHNISTMLEASLHLKHNWHVTGALGMDFGSILGRSTGFQLTVSRTNFHL